MDSAARSERLAILGGGDRCDCLRGLDSGYADLRKSDAADLAFGLQLDQGAELVGKLDVRIDAVQLKQLVAF